MANRHVKRNKDCLLDNEQYQATQILNVQIAERSLSKYYFNSV